MVEGTGLENRRGFTPSVSSNLTSSAIKFKKIPKSKDLGIFAFQSIKNILFFDRTFLGFFKGKVFF